MSAHEEATVHAFIIPSRRTRWLQKLASSKHRRAFLERLNHCHDFDDRYASPLSSNADALATLRSYGAPDICHVISDDPDIDGQAMPLIDSIDQVELRGFGTLISSIAGRLACYFDESGSKRRLILVRDND